MLKKNRQIIDVGIISVLTIISLILIPLLTGFGAGGFEREEVVRKYWMYAGPGVGFLLGIIILFLLNRFIYDDEEYGNSVLMHSPDQPPSLFSFTNTKIGIFQMLFISLIVFSILNIFVTLTQTFYMGVPSMQFTALAGISSAVEPAATAENLGAIFVMALVLLLLKRFAEKTNMNKTIFVILAIILLILSCLSYGFINHQMRYAGSEKSMLKIAGFWGTGGLITAITGSFIPFYIMHAENNLYLSLTQMYSSDIVIIFNIFFIVILVISYVLLFVIKKKRPEV